MVGGKVLRCPVAGGYVQLLYNTYWQGSYLEGVEGIQGVLDGSTLLPPDDPYQAIFHFLYLLLLCACDIEF